MRQAMRHWVAAILVSSMGIALVGCDNGAPSAQAAGAAKVAWPPTLGQPFPEVEFTNYDGRKLRMSDFKGKVVLVEPIGMNCPACNAFSGGNDRGGIEGMQPQQNLKTIEEYLVEYGGGTTLDGDDIVLVQIVLYDYKMGPVDLADVQVWTEHFGLGGNPDVFVVFSERDLRSQASWNLVPGFQLLDRTGTLRFDSTGHRPRHNMFTQLLPQVPTLLNN